MRGCLPRALASRCRCSGGCSTAITPGQALSEHSKEGSVRRSMLTSRDGPHVRSRAVEATRAFPNRAGRQQEENDRQCPPNRAQSAYCYMPETIFTVSIDFVASFAASFVRRLQGPNDAELPPGFELASHPIRYMMICRMPTAASSAGHSHFTSMHPGPDSTLL